jgi:hypothetical protein
MLKGDPKHRLTAFLNQHVFDPILKAAPSTYAVSERNTLRTAKRKTQAEKERFNSYGSAAEVRQEFQDDLSSPAAKKMNSLLRRLRLPMLADVRDEFFKLADSLGVEHGARSSHHARNSHPPHSWQKNSAKRAEAWRELSRQAREGVKPAQQTLNKAQGTGSNRFRRSHRHAPVAL